MNGHFSDSFRYPKTRTKMAHHLDLIDCVGLSREEARQERSKRLLMKRAYNAARLKAESEERTLDRILEEDDVRALGLDEERWTPLPVWHSNGRVRSRNHAPSLEAGPGLW